MLAVQRATVGEPASLRDMGATGPKELVKVRNWIAAGKTDTYDFKAYKSDDVKALLERLFHGKCAYCEICYSANAPMDVEHYRPKARVANEDGPGYWWLAMAWRNLLPSCIDCNRRRRQTTIVPGNSVAAMDATSRNGSTLTLLSSGKEDVFPVAGKRAKAESDVLEDEDPLLLNPCDDDPRLHVAFDLTGDRALAYALPIKGADGSMAISTKGAVSIQVYGLNRLALVQDRTRVRRELEFLESIVLELGALIDLRQDDPDIVRRLGMLQDRIVAEMMAATRPERTHSAMATAWMKAFKGRLSASTTQP